MSISSVCLCILPELRNLLIFFNKNWNGNVKTWTILSFQGSDFLVVVCLAELLENICLFCLCSFAVTSHAWLTPKYVWIFNASSIRNVEAADRVFFPLPDLSRKIERDSTCRVLFLEQQIVKYCTSQIVKYWQIIVCVLTESYIYPGVNC